MNKIYNTSIIPDDFLQTIFITVPIVQQAQGLSWLPYNKSYITYFENIATSDKLENNTNNSTTSLK